MENLMFITMWSSLISILVTMIVYSLGKLVLMKNDKLSDKLSMVTNTVLSILLPVFAVSTVILVVT